MDDTDRSINDEIMDKLTKVCICKGITRASIRKAIVDGAMSLEAVQKATGAGKGSCGGRRCNVKIQTLIDEYKSIEK